MTLAFSLSILGNISRYLRTKTDEKYSFDFQIVEKAFSIVMGLALIVPSLICLFFFCFGFKLNMKLGIGIMAIYSYANIFFIFASVINLIPLRLINFIAMGFAAFLSLMFLILNYNRYINSFKGNK